MDSTGASGMGGSGMGGSGVAGQGGKGTGSLRAAVREAVRRVRTEKRGWEWRWGWTVARVLGWRPERVAVSLRRCRAFARTALAWVKRFGRVVRRPIPADVVVPTAERYEFGVDRAGQEPDRTPTDSMGVAIVAPARSCSVNFRGAPVDVSVAKMQVLAVMQVPRGTRAEILRREVAWIQSQISKHFKANDGSRTNRGAR